MSVSKDWKIYNPGGKNRTLVTKMLPGSEWLDILIKSDCRIEVNLTTKIVSKSELAEMIRDNCKAVIGQLTEVWDFDLFQILSRAGGLGYCNYAVGYNNVDVEAATRLNILVGNTPGVLTETTAEMALALTMACARRIIEADNFTRLKKYNGWLPDLFMGNRLWRGTVGIVGAGRIGSAYAVMMAAAFQMDIIYAGNKRNLALEKQIEDYNNFLASSYSYTIKIIKADSAEAVLQTADVVSLHVPLTDSTRHLITADKLKLMKKDAILINTSRGQVIDEAALAHHCKGHKDFKAGLDVFEYEPLINEDLIRLPNVIVTPHIASATRWTRESMAKIAAMNIKGMIMNYPAWENHNIESFLGEQAPKAIPSVLNNVVNQNIN